MVTRTLLTKFLKNMARPEFKPIDAASADLKESEIACPAPVMAAGRGRNRSDAIAEDLAPPPPPPPVTAAPRATAAAPPYRGK